MAIATVRTKFNGKIYEVGEEIPDLGSIVCVGVDGDRYFFEGNVADANKLPKDVGTGSQATLWGTNGTIVKKFDASANEWENL